MRRDLLSLLVDPKTKNRLQPLDLVYSGEEILLDSLFDPVSENVYPIVDGIPHFIEAGEQKAPEATGLHYENSPDPRSGWKNAVRRYPAVTRFLQFVFDPAYVSTGTRNRLISNLSADSLVLNIGAGAKRFCGPQCINLDLEAYGNVDVLADGQELPFPDNSFDAVLLEYVVEHVPGSCQFVTETRRVLRPGGYVYATVPFLQAYHGNPDDYYRFTISGLRELWRDFECVACKPFGGPTSALICMLKEYLAILLSFNSKKIYSVLSQILIIPFFPLKYLDILLTRSQNAHNIAFSILFLGRKPNA